MDAYDELQEKRAKLSSKSVGKKQKSQEKKPQDSELMTESMSGPESFTVELLKQEQKMPSVEEIQKEGEDRIDSLFERLEAATTRLNDIIDEATKQSFEVSVSHTVVDGGQEPSVPKIVVQAQVSKTFGA